LGKISYRKNENWDVLSFNIMKMDNLQSDINKNIREYYPKNDIDIVDVDIHQLSGSLHKVFVFFAIK
jgi:hypothetical protein